MKRFATKIAQSGFYVILFLCISAIGISAYVMYLARDTGAKVQEVVELPTFDEITEAEPEKEPGAQSKAESAPTEAPKKEAEKPKEKKASSAASAPKKETEYVMAVNGAVTEPFSGDELVKNKTTDDWRIHSGVDIKGELGGDVKSIDAGKVINVTTDSMMGNTITVDHGKGIVCIYANLADGIALKNGDPVKRGDVIGKIGQSALAEILEEPHVHIEVTKNGKSIDPLSLYPEGKE